MEKKTGCVRRDLRCRAAAERIRTAALALQRLNHSQVSDLAGEILAAVGSLEE